MCKPEFHAVTTTMQKSGIKETGSMKMKPRKVLLALAVAAAALGTSVASTALAGTLSANFAF